MVDSNVADYIGRVVDIKIDPETGASILSSSILSKYLPKGKSWRQLTSKQKSKVIDSLSKNIKKDFESLVAKWTEDLAKKYHVSSKLYKGKKYIADDPSIKNFGILVSSGIVKYYQDLIRVVNTTGAIKSAKKV